MANSREGDTAPRSFAPCPDGWLKQFMLISLCRPLKRLSSEIKAYELQLQGREKSNGDQLQKISLSVGSLNAPLVTESRIVVLTSGGKLISLAPRSDD